MSRTMISLLSIMIAAATTAVPVRATQAPDARRIMSDVLDRPDGNDRQASLTMTLINRQNRQRVRSLISWSKDFGEDTKSIMQFTDPGDVRGVGFLSWEYEDPDRDDDRWLYLPALRRVRRIAGSSKDDAFMGSDFTYDDMGDRTVDEDTHRFVRQDTLNGHTCWVIESTPVDDDDAYSRRVSWVRTDAPVTEQVEYYDLQNNLLKVLQMQDVRMHQGFWTVFRMEMRNVQENHRTILVFSEKSYDQGVNDSMFRVQNLQRGRLQ